MPPIETDADRLEFLDADEFAAAATFDGSTITGIFQSGFAGAEYGAEVLVDSIEPIFTTRSIDVSGAVQGDTITIGGTVYTIRGIEPDGEGMTRLRLTDEN